MFVVDTNVLVYAADRDSPHHEKCIQQLNLWRRRAGAWYLTWGIIYEFLRITTHGRVMRNPWSALQAWKFIAALLDSPGIGVLVATDRHAAIVRQVFEEIPHISGNLMHDAHIAILMLEHGISRIYTRDSDFHRFPFVDPLDPLMK